MPKRSGEARAQRVQFEVVQETRAAVSDKTNKVNERLRNGEMHMIPWVKPCIPEELHWASVGVAHHEVCHL